MTYTDMLVWLDSLKGVGILPGLERMQTAMAALAHPETQFRTVHVAGTNGKGSTTAMIAAMLAANGYRVGSYSSPIVTDLRDTIRIDNEPISEEALTSAADHVKAAMPQGLSYFECITAIALCCFAQQRVDVAVIECGMGGASDTTNIIPSPVCAVFTPIAMDHAAFLGNSIEAIAKEKSGIAKPPCEIVLNAAMHDDAMTVLFEKASVSGQTVRMATLPTATVNQSGTHFQYGGHDVHLALYGTHQAENAATALTAIESLSKNGFYIDMQKAVAALATVTLPCRLERINDTHTVLLDGAHNPHGIEALCRTIRCLTEKPITLVFGMLADKDVDAAAKLIAPLCRHIICCTPPFPERAMAAAQLADITGEYHNSIEIVDDPAEAYKRAKKITAEHTPIVVGGSFYTAAAVRQAIHNI